MEYGIDSFKFDAGESNWLPSSILLNDTIERSHWPAAFTTAYVDAVSKFGPMIEVRVGRRTQQYPIFVRMLDKDSHWGFGKLKIHTTKFHSRGGGSSLKLGG